MHISCIPVESTARTFVLLVMRKQRHLTHISETAVTLMRAVFLYISILFRHFWLDQLCLSSCSRNIFYPVGLQSRKQTNQSVKLILSIYQMSLKLVFDKMSYSWKCFIFFQVQLVSWVLFWYSVINISPYILFILYIQNFEDRRRCDGGKYFTD